MSRALFLLELRQMRRSLRGRAVIHGLWVTALAATVLGGALARAHRRAGERDTDTSYARILEAQASNGAGEKTRTSTAASLATRTSSAGATAFDLSAWSDTFVARGVTSASGLVAGDLALLPDSAAIRIYEPPTMVASLAERSPSAILLGTLDLAWLLALLVPLAAIALGFDAIARDKERGTLAMILAPAPSGRPLIVARALAAAACLAIGLIPAALAGAAISGAIGGSGIDLPSLAALFSLLLGYTLFLGAAVIVVSALSDRSATALAVLILSWLTFGVAVPLGSAALTRAAYPMPDPRGRLDGELAAADVFQRPSSAVLDREVEKDPPLDPSLGTGGISTQNRYYFLLSRERYHRAKGARFEEDGALTKRVELSEIAQWLSPSTIVAAALADLAGSTPQERLEFGRDADRYRARVEALVRERVVANEDRFENAREWPRFTRSPHTGALFSFAAGLAFVVAALALLFGGAALFDRLELAPTREDA